MKKNWDIKRLDEGLVTLIERELGVPRILARSLVARDIFTPGDARAFLTPSLERDWNDPMRIPGLPEAVDALERAIRAGKRILVFGDFDVDGISSTAVMVIALRTLGCHATPFIPLRQDEGYGLSPAAIERAMSLEPNAPELFVTVDCGISSRDEVEELLARGIEVVITDHHEPKSDIPVGVPVCDPKIDPDCGSGGLAGVGVALKIVQVLGQRFGKPDLWLGLLDFAAIGTVADRMPLRGENRALVSEGLKVIHEMPRPGLATVIANGNGDCSTIDSVGLSFILIPRLNAAGRMGDATLALNLLMCDDPVEAVMLAEEIEVTNASRREVEKLVSEDADAILEETYDGERVIVLAGESWHEGVKGIVASRLVNKFGVPVILFTIDGDIAYGSGRSVGKIDLFEAVSSAQDLLERFGGHKHAVGITIKAALIDEFTLRLDEYFEKLPASDFEITVDIDSLVSFDDLTLEQVASLNALQPFGQANPEPTFAISNAFISKARAVGPAKNHLSFSITDGISDATAIYFHCDETDDYIEYAAPVDLVFTLSVEKWRNNESIKLKVKDVERSTSSFDVESSATSDYIDLLFDKIPERLTHATGRASSRSQSYSVDLDLASPEDPEFDYYDLDSEIVVALAGLDFSLRRSQKLALKELREGKNTLAVMATGRGKSMIFYIYAASMALRERKSSIFVYPLRAIIADQAFNIRQRFARLGLSARVLTGETDPDERRFIFSLWERGDIDVLLTTPEFLYWNHDKISSMREVGFIAIDEGHHVGLATECDRPVYKRLGFLREAFPQAQFLAVTATATKEIACELQRSLGIDSIVEDPSMRPNLRIDDKRGAPDRETYLASIVAKGEKCIVYVNSRQTSIELARTLRQRIPSLAANIAFYNAALSKDERKRIEEMFRDGEILTIVATSAFGEGIDVVDIRHIVLFHMPFSEIAFNQMSGRCGRDSKRAIVHLLYNQADVRINRSIIDISAPSREKLEALYKVLRSLYRATGAPVTLDEIKRACEEMPASQGLIERTIIEGIEIFTELGLIDQVEDSSDRRVSFKEDVKRVELTSSVRYCEGNSEREAFDDFCDWAIAAPAEDLLSKINHPILPGGLK